MRSLKLGVVAVAALAAFLIFSAAEWSSTVGIPCEFDRDFSLMLTATCGSELNVACVGARTNGTIAMGHKPEAFADGFLVRAYVSANDTVTVEPCCIGGLTCNPPDAGYSLRIFNP